MRIPIHNRSLQHEYYVNIYSTNTAWMLQNKPECSVNYINIVFSCWFNCAASQSVIVVVLAYLHTLSFMLYLPISSTLSMLEADRAQDYFASMATSQICLLTQQPSLLKIYSIYTSKRLPVGPSIWSPQALQCVTVPGTAEPRTLVWWRTTLSMTLGMINLSMCVYVILSRAWLDRVCCTSLCATVL